MRPLAHFKTITHHRHLVRKYCFAVGLYWRGLTHDLSKYSPTEFGGAQNSTRGASAPPSRSAGSRAIRWRGCTTRAATATILNIGLM